MNAHIFALAAGILTFALSLKNEPEPPPPEPCVWTPPDLSRLMAPPPPDSYRDDTGEQAPA